MRNALLDGKVGTAMMSFRALLSDQEIEAVIFFVRETFMEKQLQNTKYHTVENGWENHEQYRIAFPFVSGEIQLDTPWEELTEIQKRGKKLYLESCISCHDRSSVNDEGKIWESFPLSWPRNGFSNKHEKTVDAVSRASPYHLHDIKDVYVPETESEKKGQQIFQNNCAFCHAPDGSGKHWIGQFIQPHAKDFTHQSISKIYSKQRLMGIIRDGVKESAMPAWRYVLSDEEIGYVIDYMWRKFD